MNLTAWLIGQNAESILDDLTAPDGRPPAHIWVPLDSGSNTKPAQLARYQSAWAQRVADDEQWVDFAVPADTILEFLGPQALARPKSLTHSTALLSDVQTRDGVRMVKVPRYFSTVTTQWTLEQVGQDPLITRHGQETMRTTLGELNLKGSFRRGESQPGLVIDDRGPRMLAGDKGRYYNVSGWTESNRLLTEIRKISPDTPIRCAWCAN